MARDIFAIHIPAIRSIRKKRDAAPIGA